MASVPVVTEGATILLDPILASSDGTNDILVSDLIEMLGDNYTPISSTTPKGIAIIISSFINVESGTPDSYDFRWNIINQDNEITFSVQGPPEPDINNQIYSYYLKNLKLRFTNIIHNYGKTEFQFFIWEPADNFDDGTNMYITSGDPFFNVSINRVTVKLNICIPPQIVNTSVSIGNTLEISVIPREIDLGIDINTILSYIGGNYILGSESTKGIAIYSIDNTTGVWQYCLETPTSDDSFINIPSIPSSNVFLLSDSNNTGVRLRYVPNQFTIGQKTIHVRAWDTLYGTSGSLYDYTTVRGIASISSETAELVIDVLPANTTPGSISPSTVSMTTITENMRLSQAYLNGEYIKNLTGIQYTEGSVSFKGVAIYELDNTNGVWQYSISGGDINIPWTNIPAVDSSNYLLLKYEETKIRFIPNYRFYNSSTYIKIKTWDGSIGYSTLHTNTLYNINTPPIKLNAFSTDSVTINITFDFYTIVAPSVNNNYPNYTNVIDWYRPRNIPLSSFPTLSIESIINILGDIYVLGTSPLKGIAIHPSTFSIIEYKREYIDNSWNLMPSSSPNFFLLKYIAGTRLKIINSYNNLEYLNFYVFYIKLWDTTEGEDASIYQISNTGGDSAFSTSDLGITIRIINVSNPYLVDSANIQLTGIENTILNIPISTFISSIGTNYFIQCYDYINTTKYLTGKRGIIVYNLNINNGSWSTSNLTSEQISNAMTNSNAIIIESTDTLVFTPNSNWSGTITFNYRGWSELESPLNPIVPIPTGPFDDSTFSFIGGTTSIYIPPANNAPVLTPLLELSLAPYTLPEFYAVEGEKIYSVIDILNNYTITDTNNDTVGCAIYDMATSGIGSWYYSINNKQTWVAFPSVSLTSSLHLQRNADTYIKFVPTNNKVFTTSTAMTGYTATNTYLKFYAWDTTNISSLVNLIGDATNRGEANPYSTYPGHLYLIIKSGPPSLTVTGLTTLLFSTNEDTSDYNIIKINELLTSIGVNYTKYNSSDEKGLAIRIPNVNGYEYTINNGNTWSSTSGSEKIIVFTNSSNNQIRYRPPTNYNGTQTIIIYACDMYNNINGEIISNTTAIGPTLYTASSFSDSTEWSILVNSVNDSPSISGSYIVSPSPIDWYPGITTTNIDISLSNIVNSLTFTDVDVENPQSVTGIAIINVDTIYGFWYYTINNKETWYPLVNISDTNALHLTQNSNTFIRYTGTTLAGLSQITVRAWDGTNTIVNGTKTSITSYGSTTPYSELTSILSRQTLPIVPDSPYGLVGNSVENTGINLSWTEPLVKGGAPILRYNIYVSSLGGEFSLNKSVESTSTTLTSLTPGIQYSIYVTTENSKGESNPTTTLTITYLARPQLINSPTILLNQIVKNITDELNIGTTVEYIIDTIGDNYISVLPNDTRGIAITSIDTNNGYWQYKTENTNGWQTITDILSINKVLLLYNSPDNYLRFIPNYAFSGTINLNFVAWDAKNGTVGAIYTIPNDSMSFSIGTGILSLNIENINTRPTISGNTYTIDWLPTTTSFSINTILSNFIISDLEQSGLTAVGIAIFNINSTIGSLEYTVNNGVSWNTITSISSTNALHLSNSINTKIRFIKNSEYTTGEIFFDFYAWDQSNTSVILNNIGNTTQNVSAYSIDSKKVILDVYTYPSPPRNIVATVNYNNNRINLAWNIPEFNGNSLITKYNIYIVQNNEYVLIPRSDSIVTNWDYVTPQWGDTYTFCVRSENSIGESLNTDTIQIQFGERPQIINSPSILLTTIERNTTNTSGNLIEYIITQLGNNFIDTTNSDKGIAITNYSNLNGTWQYSTNGTTWLNIPTLNTNQLFLMTPGAGRSIRFIPNINYQGTETIHFRAWIPRAYESYELYTYVENSPYFSSQTASASITIEGGTYINTNTQPSITGTYTFTELITPNLHTPVALNTILDSFIINDINNNQNPPNIGCAIIMADVSIGTWLYSIDNKLNWTMLLSIDTTNAVHLSRSSTTYLKFVPFNQYSIGLTNIQICAWDLSNEINNGGIGIVTSNEISSAYSINRPILNLSVSTIPTAPQNVSVITNSQPAEAIISWNPPLQTGGKSILNYNIYRIINNSPVLEIITPVINGNTITATLTTGFIPGNTYSFKICAVNQNGQGDLVTITANFESLTLPESPTNVVGLSKNGFIQLSWSAPSNKDILPIIYYNIYDDITDTIIGTITNTGNNITTNLEIETFRVYKLYIEAVASLTKKTSSYQYTYVYPYSISDESIKSKIETTITQYGNEEDILLKIIISIIQEYTEISYNMTKRLLKAYLDIKGPANNIKLKSEFIFSFVKSYYDEENSVYNIFKELFKIVADILQEITLLNSISLNPVKVDRILYNCHNIKDIIETSNNLSIDDNLKQTIKKYMINLLLNTSHSTKSEIITSLIGITYIDNSMKKNIISIIQSLIPRTIISLYQDETAVLKSLIPSNKYTSEFQNLKEMKIIIPSITQSVNIPVDIINTPIFIVLEPDINYKISLSTSNKKIMYSSGEISILGQNVGLNSIITFNTTRFKIIEIGSLTLEYLSDENILDTSNYPPHKAYYSSELTEYKRNVTQYNYVRVMEDTDPDFKYQYKDETERIQTKLGKITTPQAIAFRRNGGPPCS